MQQQQEGAGGLQNNNCMKEEAAKNGENFPQDSNSQIPVHQIQPQQQQTQNMVMQMKRQESQAMSPLARSAPPQQQNSAGLVIQIVGSNHMGGGIHQRVDQLRHNNQSSGAIISGSIKGGKNGSSLSDRLPGQEPPDEISEPGLEEENVGIREIRHFAAKYGNESHKYSSKILKQNPLLSNKGRSQGLFPENFIHNTAPNRSLTIDNKTSLSQLNKNIVTNSSSIKPDKLVSVQSNMQFIAGTHQNQDGSQQITGIFERGISNFDRSNLQFNEQRNAMNAAQTSSIQRLENSLILPPLQASTLINVSNQQQNLTGNTKSIKVAIANGCGGGGGGLQQIQEEGSSYYDAELSLEIKKASMQKNNIAHNTPLEQKLSSPHNPIDNLDPKMPYTFKKHQEEEETKKLNRNYQFIRKGTLMAQIEAASQLPTTNLNQSSHQNPQQSAFGANIGRDQMTSASQIIENNKRQTINPQQNTGDFGNNQRMSFNPNNFAQHQQFTNNQGSGGMFKKLQTDGNVQTLSRQLQQEDQQQEPAVVLQAPESEQKSLVDILQQQNNNLKANSDFKVLQNPVSNLLQMNSSSDNQGFNQQHKRPAYLSDRSDNNESKEMMCFTNPVAVQGGRDNGANHGLFQINLNNRELKLIDSSRQDSIITPAFKMRQTVRPGFFDQNKSAMNYNNDPEVASNGSFTRRQHILAKGFLSGLNNVTSNVGGGRTSPQNVQNLKTEERKKKILDLTDFLPENKTQYYLYMPDEEEKIKLQQYQKQPTLELPGSVLNILHSNNAFLRNNEINGQHFYPNKSQKPLTLVFELFDILVKIIDPKNDSMDITEDSFKCFHVQMKPPQLVFMKCNEVQLIEALKDLQQYAELILYTCLPESLIQSVFSQQSALSELQNIFSYVLTQKDCIQTEDTVLKDLSKLLNTRSKDQIIVVDTNTSNVDGDVNAFIFQNKYLGDDYNELTMLRAAIVNNLIASQPLLNAPPFQTNEKKPEYQYQEQQQYFGGQQ